MAPEDITPDTEGAPSWRWVAGWTLLTTAAIPAALIAMAPLAALLLWFIDLGSKTGLWPGTSGSTLTAVGFAAAFAAILAAIQWYYLRNFLPHAGWWFAATGGGILLAGLAAGVAVARISAANWDPQWGRAALLLTFGLVLGFVQWLALRCLVPHALWIIPIDGLAASIPLFFVCIWVYASFQLALAKSNGIYATPEEAVIALTSQG